MDASLAKNDGVEGVLDSCLEDEDVLAADLGLGVAGECVGVGSEISRWVDFERLRGVVGVVAELTLEGETKVNCCCEKVEEDESSFSG